ncbi:MAG: hypothetical protein MUF83_11755 [Acidimicrobiales bacterium]|jgi:polyhydroxyalkanoate synthesis regulator phasin|nr:hypothetical protein [Acidimicrobiales bacterium]
MKKSIAVLGLTAGILGGAAAGVALTVPGLAGAQDDTTSTTTETESGRPDHATRLQEVLAPLVEDGTITQAQADAVVNTLVEAGPPMGRGGGNGPGRGAGMDAAATSLGMTSDELRTELANGSSIAEVAAARGVDVQVVIDAMVAEAKAHLDEEVAAGEHTQEEADAKLAEITERITAMVNGEMPAGGPGMGPGGRGHHGD